MIKRPIIVITIATFIISIIYANNKYKKFYQKVTEEVNLEAVVISDNQETEYYNSYIIKGKNNLFKNKRFKLYTKKDMNYGDKITLEGSFYKPPGAKNYKGFNYKQYMQSNNIYGTIKSNNIKKVSKNDVNIVLRLSNNLKIKIIKNIKEILPEDTSNLLIGILLGDKTGVGEQTITSFQKSSLAHILAVSGTHISYISLGLLMLITHSKVPKRFGYIIIIIFLVFFLFITNFLNSAIRASIMAIIIILSKLLYRKADTINSIFIAILLTIINNPFSIFSVSIQLSYFGTIGVVFVSPIIETLFLKIKIKPKVARIISVPVSAYVTILPIIILNFKTISLTFLISNIIAIPLLGFIIIGGFITLFTSFVWLWFAQKIAIGLNLLLKTLMFISTTCSNLKFSKIYVVTPNFISIILYYSLLLIIIYIYHLKNSNNLNCYEEKILSNIKIKKIVACFLIIIIILEFPYTRYNGKLKIYFIDVGQRRQHFNCKP